MFTLPSQRWLALSLVSALSLFTACSKDGGPALPMSPGGNPTVSGGGSALSWRPMDSGVDELLWSVWGAADNNGAISVGTRGTADHLANGIWNDKATGTGKDLCDVWSTTDGRAFAVGVDGLILSYDGTAWSDMVSGTTVTLNDAYGFAPNDVVAVGGVGTVLHFDGSSWSPMQSGSDVSLFGVWGSSLQDLFVVGVGGTILHYDGVAWTFMTSPTPENLSSVWGTASNDVWAAGDVGTILHFDGVEWSLVAGAGHTQNTFGSSMDLYDVWGSATDDVWAVGVGGTILHYDGKEWSASKSGTDRDLFGVWGRAKDEVYACGDHGTILRFGEEKDDRVLWVLHDHPDGGVAPPKYGLRLDDLLSPGNYTFSFDFEGEKESAFVTLVYSQAAGTIHIQGRAFGGRDTGTGWDPSTCGWVDLDFVYTAHVSVRDDCGGLSGDDLYVTHEDNANGGTVKLDGWGGNETFRFTDRSGELGCSLVFDNDTDSKRNAELANDPDAWSGSGWLQPAVNGSRDWLFFGRKVK